MAFYLRCVLSDVLVSLPFLVFCNSFIFPLFFVFVASWPIVFPRPAGRRRAMDVEGRHGVRRGVEGGKDVGGGAVNRDRRHR